MIQAGAPLRVLLTLMNTSATYALEKLSVKIIISRGKKDKDSKPIEKVHE